MVIFVVPMGSAFFLVETIVLLMISLSLMCEFYDSYAIYALHVAMCRSLNYAKYSTISIVICQAIVMVHIMNTIAAIIDMAIMVVPRRGDRDD